MARRAILALLLAAPPLALGQTITVTESNDTDRIVNVAECSGAVTDQLTFTWTISNFTATGTFDLLASDQASCPLPTTTSGTTAHTVTLQAGIPATTGSGSSTSNVVTVSSLLSQLQIACPGPATVVYFCVDYNSGFSTPNAATGNLTLDLQSPPAPNALDPTPGDSALNVSWTQGSGSADAGTSGAANGYNVYCDVHPATSPISKRCASVTGGGTLSTRIGGLTNGTQYDVEVTATTQGANESGRSNLVTGTPEEVNDFWRQYRSAGGREAGGCATGAAGLVAVLALVPLAMRRRGRRP